MTSDTSSGATAALLRTSLMTAEPKSWTGTVEKAPLKEPRAEGKGGRCRGRPGRGPAHRALGLRTGPTQLLWAQSWAQVTRSSRDAGRRLPETRGRPAGPFPGSEGAGHASLTKEAGVRGLCRRYGTKKGRSLEPSDHQRDARPAPLGPPGSPAPEPTELSWPIRSSRDSASFCQPMGGSEGAVARPREPARARGPEDPHGRGGRAGGPVPKL